MTTIGKRLKQWRKENKLSITDIAETTGIALGSISAYENDKKAIGSKPLVALYENYNMDINWILTGKKKDELHLSEIELELIDNFRKCTDKNKYKILGYIESLIDNEYAISIDNKGKSYNSEVG